MRHLMLKPAKVILFLVINLFNFRIADVALGYFRPTFREPFLLNKQQLAENDLFKAGLAGHGSSACIALFLCSLLVLFRIENSKPKLHRILGKTALYLVFGAVVPGGIVLAFYASGGRAGKFLFFTLAVYTLSIAVLALKKAKARRINQHKLLMTELLCLLCSAILLRLLLMLFATTTHLNWELVYPLSVSLSWLPIAILFLFLKKRASYNLKVE